MSPIAWGLLSAGSLGCADFAARFSSQAIGHGRALLGMLIVSVLVLTVYVAATGHSGAIPTSVPWTIVAHGVVFAIAMLLLYAALAIGPIKIVVPVIATHPALVVVWTWLSGSPLTPAKLVGLGLIILGCVAIAAAKDATDDEVTQDRTQAALGSAVAIAAVASIFYAGMLITGQEAARTHDAISTLWLGRVVALATLIPYLMFTRQRPTLPMRWWPLLTAQGLLDSGGMLFLLFGSLGEHREVAAVISSGFGAVTIFLACIFLKERITLPQLFATAVIFLGAAVLTKAI